MWFTYELQRRLAGTGVTLVAGGNVDLALLDGYYLRRSDAEIFGEAAAGRARK